MICISLHTSPQYLLQDSLELNDFDLQLRLLDKIRLLLAAQAELAESLIVTMLMQMA